MINAAATQPQNVVFVPLDQLAATIESIVYNKIREKQEEDLQEQFLSPEKTRQLFNPAVSIVTLNSWTDKGYLKKHVIGGRVYYKYSEVMQAVKEIKKYSRS